MCAPNHLQDVAALIQSMTALTDQIEELNTYLAMAPDFIDTADRLCDALDAIEAAEAVSTWRTTTEASTDPSRTAPTDPWPGYLIPDTLSRSASPGSVSCGSSEGWPSRSPSLSGPETWSSRSPSLSSPESRSSHSPSLSAAASRPLGSPMSVQANQGKMDE